MTALQRLTAWYDRHCDGDWEHGYGFTISTIDNPGVSLDVNLRETRLESIPFEEKRSEYESKGRWMVCRRNQESFQAYGAACRLEDMIEEFLAWAERNENSA